MDHPSPVLPSPEWLADDPPAPAPTPAPAPAPAPHEQHLRPAGVARFVVQMGAVVFCLFLVVRTVGVEPFGVPTGSMAPTLFGNHREAECPRCGYRVVVGEPGPEGRPVDFARCRCPNCNEEVDLARAREVPGDRLMVDKSAFLSRPPRRWEVAVFHCPADLSKPYVKRVVGLPGEFIQVSGGDVYANGELVRKTLAQARETRVPVFDLNFPPEPDGWASRWLVEPVAVPALPTAARPPAKRVDETILRDNALYLDATASKAGVGLTYRHRDVDTLEEEPVGDYLAYNGSPARAGGFARDRAETAHDLLLTFDLEVRAGRGAFACGLGDGADTVRADIPVGEGTFGVFPDAGPGGSTGTRPPLPAGKTVRVEFAFVDRRVSLAVDGAEVVPPLDLPADPPGKPRRGNTTRPVRLGCRGVDVVVRNLRVDRDIHYLSLRKAGEGWQLPPGEFFVLGDNTANSHDSRMWQVDNRPAPGAPGTDFIGKPFVIHQPLRLARVTVNGRGRVFQTLDWSRLRWLR